MLKTLTTKSVKFRKNRIKVDGDVRSKFDNSEVNGNMVDGNEIRDDELAKKKNYQKTFEFKKSVRSLGFFIFKDKLIFIKLKQAFVKTLIFYHFNLECHIQIKTNISHYTIDKVFSQLVLNNLNQLHPMIFFP